MPLFTTSYQKISSWAASRAHHHHHHHRKSNTSDESTKLGSSDGETSPTKRASFSSPLGNCGIESDGHGDETHMLGLDFMKHWREELAVNEMKNGVKPCQEATSMV